MLKGKTIDRVLFIVRVVALVNFVLLALGASVAGGDAFNGKIEDGRFFLGVAGKFKEVSHGVWLYSYYHVVSNFVTAGLAVVALTIMSFRGLMSLDSDGGDDTASR